MSENKKLIRNSTAEFLIFTGQAGEQSIEARYARAKVGAGGTAITEGTKPWRGFIA